MRSHHNNRELRATLLQAIEQCQSVHARHANIGDQHIRRAVVRCRQQMFCPLKAARLHTRQAQGLFQHPAQRLVVVNDPYFDFSHGYPPRGRSAESAPGKPYGPADFRIRSGRRGDSKVLVRTVSPDRCRPGGS